MKLISYKDCIVNAEQITSIDHAGVHVNLHFIDGRTLVMNMKSTWGVREFMESVESFMTSVCVKDDEDDEKVLEVKDELIADKEWQRK